MNFKNILSLSLLLSILQMFAKFASSDEAAGEKKKTLSNLQRILGSHIKEHLMETYGFNTEQAEKYLKEYDAQTQFFVMHDYDNNTKLDGLELLKSMTHFHDEHDDDHAEKKEDPQDNTDTLVEFVDMILKDQDYNKDGYIDYPEYISYYTKFENEDGKAERSKSE